MKLSEFLEAVLPAGKHILAVKEYGNGRHFIKHVVCQDHEATLATIKKFAPSNKDIYYALASFQQGFHKDSKGKKVVRVASNVDQLKALWFDIDFKGGLSDPKHVVAALQGFHAGSGMPAPSILVHSGNGIHAYWPLTEAVPVARWQKMADALKVAAKLNGLQADLVCTADCARILRPPGTKNWKDATNPKPVLPIFSSGKLFTPEELEAILLVQADDALGAVPEHLRSLQATDELGTTARKPVESMLVNIIKECAVAKHNFDTRGADCTEPEWTAMLQLLRHCTDGELWYHEVSQGHPGYVPAATEAKWEARKSNEAGPTLCSTFELYHPELCAACPHYKKIKTPLVTGVEITAVAPGGIVLSTWRINPHGDGMERKMYNEETKEYEWVKVLRRAYDSVETTRSAVTKHFEMHFDVKMQNADDIKIVLPSGHLGNDHKLKELMANFGAPLFSAEVNPFRELMSTWLEKLQAAKAVDEVTEQLGWIRSADSDDNEIIGFSSGDTSYYTTGEERQGVRISREFAAIGRMYVPAGAIAPWKRAAKFLSDQNNPAFTAVLSSAFASPLLHFTGIQGGILSIVSPESGVGKTSALKAAQAVWGSPTHGMNSIDDTRLSVARKLGFLNNLPAYWDELRGKKTMEDFMVLAFQVSQGKEKSRLDSSAAMREVHTWETMLVAASNESIFDCMATYSGGSDAGVARTYEITCYPFETDKSRAEIGMMFETLHNNYGHAGKIYAKYIADNHVALRAEVAEMFHRLSVAGHMRASERFWFAMMAAMIVGARAAGRCKLVDIDVKTLAAYLIKNVDELRGRSQVSMLGSDPKELVAAYIMQHQDRGLVVRELKTGSGGRYIAEIIREPKQDKIIYQIGVDDGTVRVARGDFTSWLARSKEIRFSNVESSLKKECGMTKLRSSLGLGTRWQLPRVQCLDFTLDYDDVVEGVVDETD